MIFISLVSPNMKLQLVHQKKIFTKQIKFQFWLSEHKHARHELKWPSLPWCAPWIRSCQRQEVGRRTQLPQTPLPPITKKKKEKNRRKIFFFFGGLVRRMFISLTTVQHITRSHVVQRGRKLYETSWAYAVACPIWSRSKPFRRIVSLNAFGNVGMSNLSTNYQKNINLIHLSV